MTNHADSQPRLFMIRDRITGQTTSEVHTLTAAQATERGLRTIDCGRADRITIATKAKGVRSWSLPYITLGAE